MPRLLALPFLWKHETGTQAVGLCVADRVWAGNDKGDVVVLTKDGVLERTMTLPAAVHSIFVDETWRLAGCHDGNVWDLSGSVPRVRHALAPLMAITALTVHKHRLVVADTEGGLTVVDVEGNRLWEHRDDNAGEGWMACADDDGVYHGSADGVRAYDWSGALVWAQPKVDDVRFGSMRDGELLVTGGWGKRQQSALCAVTKRGKLRVRVALKLDVKDWVHNGAESCCADDARLFASCGGSLFCFDRQGKPLWTAPMGAEGPACSMQVDPGDVRRIFLVTTSGAVACLDVATLIRAPSFFKEEALRG